VGRFKGAYEENKITVGELKKMLQGHKDDTRISLAGGLTIYRIKTIADDEVFLEFNEPQAYLEPSFRKKNPNVKIAFIAIDDIAWVDDGIAAEPIDVSVR
jgi:hypothetical protein